MWETDELETTAGCLPFCAVCPAKLDHTCLYATSIDCALVCREPSRKFLDKMIEMRDTLFIVID